MTYIQECESLAGKGEAETWNSFYLVFFWGEPVQGAEQGIIWKERTISEARNGKKNNFSPSSKTATESKVNFRWEQNMFHF